MDRKAAIETVTGNPNLQTKKNLFRLAGCVSVEMATNNFNPLGAEKLLSIALKRYRQDVEESLIDNLEHYCKLTNATRPRKGFNRIFL